MQLMTWVLGRLGSRFCLVFEPHNRRVLHSALGRFLDEPLDLAVGLVEPDGTQRVLPFCKNGQLLFNCEQFERTNSITYRGFSERYKLRFEFNVHAVFYPQNEQLCTMPAFYLEMRLNPQNRVRWETAVGPQPDKVKLFLRVARGDTQITAKPADATGGARLDLSYAAPQKPRSSIEQALPADVARVPVRERIVSLNPEARVDAAGQGLECEIPVSEVGSGVKWRLVWGACCVEPILKVTRDGSATTGRFRYARRLPDIDAVVQDALDNRDERLALSRRFEKLIDQAPLSSTQRHLINQGFHNFLANTFWCDLEDGAPWFSVWEGSCYFHSTVDVEYNTCLWYLALWPQLLELQFGQWARFGKDHAESGGVILAHDIGHGCSAGQQAYPHDMPVEENCNYLLMLQAYCHWTGNVKPARQHLAFVEKLAKYLIWADRTGSGFPSEGNANTIDDASPAMQYSRKQTYLAVKRLAALRAAADLLDRGGQPALAANCRQLVEAGIQQVESQAWLGDHYAVCIDRSTAGIHNVWTGAPLPYDELAGWDAYSIYTANGLLLPTMIGQPLLLDPRRLDQDLNNSLREAMSPYGCGHSSSEPENVWVSQNLWRDHLAFYLGHTWAPLLAGRYWDMQVMSNSGQVSKGFIDTYINNNLCFYPRGAAAMGYFLAQPRLVIDRLAPEGQRISINPERKPPQRWPLFPLADWPAHKIPICVVDLRGNVLIEGQTDPVTIHDPRRESAGHEDSSVVIG